MARPWFTGGRVLPGVLFGLLGWIASGAEVREPTWPASSWSRITPTQAGLEELRLEQFSRFVGGRGVVVRRGYWVYSWGDVARRGDVASACKPVFTHFLFRALAERQIGSLDDPVVRWEPRLKFLNPELGFKDRSITWRHLATQTSCYGLIEAPGTAFAYNDWQIALLADLLFNGVYTTPWSEVDSRVLGPLLMDRIGCEDSPSFVLQAGGRQPGRLSISPRDFARFGLLYLRNGRWKQEEILPADWVHRGTHTPLSVTLPRAGTQSAPLLPGQRTLGSQKIPDNQTEHFGSYSFLWWINGVESSGKRHWPDAPQDTYAALGHGGKRALWIIPSLDLVVSWNDSIVESPAQENEALRRLIDSGPTD